MTITNNHHYKNSDFLALFLLFLLSLSFYFCKNIVIPHLFLTSEISIWVFKFTFNNLSGIFNLITIFIFFIGILSSWSYLIKNVTYKLFFMLTLFLISCLASFSAANLLTFYFFFELTSLPIIFFLFLFGKRKRNIKAIQLYLIFTLLGSILIFISLLLIKNSYSESITLIISFLITAFFIKMPIFPFYLWLPEAHVESPTIGSIFLAGIILKLGGFGFIKFVSPIINLSYLNLYFLMILSSVAIISVILSSISAIVVHDFKKIIAYSSISHMGIIFLNMITPINSLASGNIIGMISHSFTASSLFLIAGILYDKMHTRNTLYFSGLGIKMPILSIFVLWGFLANISFPFTLGFIGELLIFLSIGLYSKFLLIIIFFANFLIILFSFKFVKIFYFGNIGISSKFKLKDISRKDTLLLVFLLLPQLFFGIFPSFLLNILSFL